MSDGMGREPAYLSSHATNRYFIPNWGIYVLELKLSNNGGIHAATQQIRDKQYAEPFKADKRRVVALAIELDDQGKGLVDWKEA